MIAPRFIPLVLKHVSRHTGRTLITVMGVGLSMFLFTFVQAMHTGVTRATQLTAADTTLIVYRKDRFCPATSLLPQDYERRIAAVDGVVSVVPMMIVVNNCRTSLDVVTFRGVPKDTFLDTRRGKFEIISGSIEDWMRRSDATLLGETLAKRRGLRPGDTFDAAGITAYVAGVVRSDEPQDQNVAYADLAFVQQASRGGLGIVTQFSVKVADSSMLDDVAAAIDEEFARAQEPTDTSPEKAFVGRVASDLVELVGFARWLGLACLLAVLGLVGNSIMLSVQDRIAQHAVLQTLGYRSGLIARLILVEGIIVSCLGGLFGGLVAFFVARTAHLAITAEGMSVPIHASLEIVAQGLLVCASMGIVAGILPALQASRRTIAGTLRSV